MSATVTLLETRPPIIAVDQASRVTAVVVRGATVATSVAAIPTPGPAGANGAPGPAGPPGEPGAPGTPAYIHTQLSPLTTWTINHNRGAEPSVTVLSVGGTEVLTEVVHTSPNQTLILFAAPASGTARLT